jgi:hypothetical protein
LREPPVRNRFAMAHALLLSSPCSLVLLYGEEIGMDDVLAWPERRATRPARRRWHLVEAGAAVGSAAPTRRGPCFTRTMVGKAVLDMGEQG